MRHDLMVTAARGRIAAFRCAPLAMTEVGRTSTHQHISTSNHPHINSIYQLPLAPPPPLPPPPKPPPPPPKPPPKMMGGTKPPPKPLRRRPPPPPRLRRMKNRMSRPITSQNVQLEPPLSRLGRPRLLTTSSASTWYSPLARAISWSVARSRPA